MASAVASAFLSLRRDELFCAWPQQVFDAFTDLFTLREVRRYEVLFRFGLPSVSFLVLVEGSVSLARPRAEGPIDAGWLAPPVAPGRAGSAAAAPMLGPTQRSLIVRAGETLGHAALALRPRGTAIPRRHTATIRDRGWVMSVSRADLEQSPAMRHALWRHGTMAAAEAREVACMLGEAPLFDALGVVHPAALAEAARLFQYVELPAGTQLQPRGKPPVYFQLLVGGDAAAAQRMPGGEEVHSVLSDCADACYFGDRAVLAGEKAGPASDSVDALGPCQVLRLRGTEAWQLLNALPALRPLLRDRRRMRHSALVNRLAMRGDAAGGTTPMEETDEMPPPPTLPPSSPKPEESSVLVTLGECDVGSEVALPAGWQPAGGGRRGRGRRG
jgi:CRP-like cAMP-binding protein